MRYTYSAFIYKPQRSCSGNDARWEIIPSGDLRLAGQTTIEMSAWDMLGSATFVRAPPIDETYIRQPVWVQQHDGLHRPLSRARRAAFRFKTCTPPSTPLNIPPPPPTQRSDGLLANRSLREESTRSRLTIATANTRAL